MLVHARLLVPELPPPMKSHSRLSLLTLTTAALIAALLGAAPAGAQDTPTCDGLEATIIGTEGRDNLRGTPGDDVIVGLGGPDRIVGLGGNDTICGGEGRDRIRGNNGKDTIFGEGGRDRIHGGGGADTIRGNGGNDRLNGGNGNDTIRGNRGNDVINGDAGADDCVDTTASIAGCRAELEGDTFINLSRANWSSGYIHAEVIAELLREMGYTVSSPDVLEFAPDLGYQVLARGESDIYVNGWFPGHYNWFEGQLADGSSIGEHIRPARFDETIIQDGGLQGFLVTKAWADNDGFTTLDQINADEALWSQLDTDGNGKGEIYGCPEDWTCDDIINSMIVFNNWDNLEQVQAGYDAMFAEFLTLAEAGEPAITYTWTPTSYFALAEPGNMTMWLSMEDDSVLDDSNPLGFDIGVSYSQRDGDIVGHRDVTPGTCLIGPDGCQLGWLGAWLQPVYNIEWGQEQQPAVRLLEELDFSAFDLSVLNIELSLAVGSQADISRLGKKWIAENRATADEWIAAALDPG